MQPYLVRGGINDPYLFYLFIYIMVAAICRFTVVSLDYNLFDDTDFICLFPQEIDSHVEYFHVVLGSSAIRVTLWLPNSKGFFLGGPVPPLYVSFPGVGPWFRGCVIP